MGHKDWKALARKAANEQDPKKLLAIIEELNEALEERENQVRGRVSTKTEQGNRLLFVDDEASIRLTLPPILQERGCQEHIAASVSEARTAIKAHKFDVLLSDLNIDRESDGFTVIHAMREANPDCVTVLLTAYPAFETAVRSIRAEVDDYFRNLCQKIRFKRPIRSIYAAASGFVGSCSSALKPNLASSSCTIRAVCALCRMYVSKAPRAIPNISIPSNKRTSGAELTIDTV